MVRHAVYVLHCNAMHTAGFKAMRHVPQAVHLQPWAIHHRLCAMCCGAGPWRREHWAQGRPLRRVVCGVHTFHSPLPRVSGTGKLCARCVTRAASAAIASKCSSRTCSGYDGLGWIPSAIETIEPSSHKTNWP